MIKVDAKFAFVLFVPFCGQFVLLRSIDVDRASNNTPGGSRRLRGRRGDVQVSESVLRDASSALSLARVLAAQDN
jgi:hypothetical protein